jgi:hypothetical protein
MRVLSTPFPPLGEAAARIHADAVVLVRSSESRRHSGRLTIPLAERLLSCQRSIVILAVRRIPVSTVTKYT